MAVLEETTAGGAFAHNQGAAALTAPQGRAQKGRGAIVAWLFFMCALVVLMVLVGGATRLTDSGLSITEWKPVTGAIPPLSEAAWLAEFDKYKQIPEYALVNQGMSLSAFKVIYYWEWGHRLLGRVIGLAFIAPLIYFLVRGFVSARLGAALFGLFILGGAQGALGWYMVQSGLTERVDVSQYRLAAHLGLAILLFAALFWTALAVRNPLAPAARWKGLGLGALVLTIGVYGQIILGAFVAGLRAGHTYTTWPLMDGRFFPEAYFHGGQNIAALFESIAAVQFNHRIGAYMVAAGAVWFYLAARNSELERRARYLLYAVGGQVLLGIVTLVSATPIHLGLAHQGGALIVFAAALYALHGAVHRPAFQ